ncbi:hypothetical protein BDQ17DRAFT_204623 [Cyathus striatus]|nr:hypothetical protein BDQ17DRAFT_204623 [Cyathus striatus]
MFDRARSFVIQNSAFVENLYVKKVYRRSAHSTSNNFHQGGSQLMSNRDYQQIRKGDINIIECIDGPVLAGCVYKDFVVEVSGEDKRKVARIYHGRRGCTQLKKELEMLSKMWPHPSIPQIFGIYKSNDTTGLIFHDDGTRQRCWEYMQTLRPLQRAAFFIRYLSDYIVGCVLLSRNSFHTILEHFEIL